MNTSDDTTDLAIVRRAQQRAESPELAQKALGELCVTYWYPVYAFIRRRRNADAAADLTQAFFTDLLARGIDTYDRRRVRFRHWLRGAANNFVSGDTTLSGFESRTPPFALFAAAAAVVPLGARTGRRRNARN